jgi:hypothetical protein
MLFVLEFVTSGVLVSSAFEHFFRKLISFDSLSKLFNADVKEFEEDEGAKIEVLEEEDRDDGIVSNFIFRARGRTFPKKTYS